MPVLSLVQESHNGRVTMRHGEINVPSAERGGSHGKRWMVRIDDRAQLAFAIQE